MHYSRLVGGLTALAVLLILLAAPAAWAATLTPVWSGDYTTAANDGFTAVAAGPDGAVYAAGYAQAKKSGAASQLLLVKYVDGGTTMTRAWYVLAGFEPMRAARVVVDPSGNVIVAGTQGPIDLTGRGSDIVVLKCSPAGKIVWRMTYDGPAHRVDYVNDLALDARGDALVVGAASGRGTGRDYITLKVRANGSKAWARRYAGPEVFDEARGVAVDAKGNVYVTGWSNDKDRTRRARTICYSATGVRRWIASDTTRHSWSGAADVVLSGSSGSRGVIISGYQGMRRGSEQLMFTKYATTKGKVIWKRILPSNAQATEPHAAAVDGNGAPITVGMTNDTGIQGFIGGVSAGGADGWRSVFSSAVGTPDNPGEAEFDAVAVSTAGGVLAGGWTQAAEPTKELYDYIPSAFIVRYSPAWPITAPLDYVGPGSATTQSKCTAVAIGSAGMYAVGEQTSPSGDLDAVILKF
jgi:hypothetical protein